MKPKYSIIFQILILLAVSVLAFYVRITLLLKIRTYLVLLIVLPAIVIFTINNFKLYKNKTKKALYVSLIFLSLVPILILGLIQYKFYTIKQSVLNLNPTILERYGKHFIVSYDKFDEIKTLVDKKAIAGIFLSQNNIKNKSFEDVKKEIKSLQDIRKSQSMPPLLVATDQEGGIVSRLTPIIPYQDSLASVIKDAKTDEELENLVREYATQQAKNLADLGVNLNLSPVVDINYGTVTKDDQYSMINQRAISNDPYTVAKVGAIYSKILLENNVSPTLKHFPGLGRANVDTHLNSASLDTSLEDLEKSDFVPFREITKNSNPFIMLSHITLTSVDAQNPVSTSKKVVQNILRNKIGFNGVLITDDFSMGAINNRNLGVEKAVVNSLNAGVDLILISYDHDLYYQAMFALEDAETNHQIDATMLESSDKRLAKVFSRS
jgi:beta-N-acetylhexosaminidase